MIENHMVLSETKKKIIGALNLTIENAKNESDILAGMVGHVELFKAAISVYNPLDSAIADKFLNHLLRRALVVETDIEIYSGQLVVLEATQ